MESNLPVKSLIRLNWLAAAVGCLYVFFYSIPDQVVTKVSISFTAMAGFGLLFSGYVNLYLLRFYRRKYATRRVWYNLARFFISFAICAVFHLSIIPFFALLAGVTWSYEHSKIIPSIIVHTAVSNLLIMLLQNTIVLQYDKSSADLELSRLTVSNAEAANLLLRQQIHPHFLFNALNTLKALYKKGSSEGEEYLVHLANFLRASISNHSSRIATVMDELELYLNYLEMQRIRFGSALVCEIDIQDPKRRSYFMPSFSLQPLLENAIKHNEVTEENPLTVILKQEGDWITVSNNVQPKRVKENSDGYGLANLAERYRLWSGDEVLISKDDNFFSVSLKILPDEHCNNRG